MNNEDRFEKINAHGPIKERLERLAYMSEPYTPPAPVAAWLAKYDVEKPPTRNYAAILEAAKRKPVGYWADAPRGIQFGGGRNNVPVDVQKPDATPSSDDLYEPVGTIPVIGDRLVHPSDKGKYLPHVVMSAPAVAPDATTLWRCNDIYCALGVDGRGFRILKRRKALHAS